MAKKAMLTVDMDMETAVGLVKTGKVPMEAFLEWDAARSRTAGSKTSARRLGEVQISRANFLSEAKPVEITINGTPALLEPKMFSTGSFGWGFSGKVVIKAGNIPLKTQASINLAVVGSKDAK